MEKLPFFLDCRGRPGSPPGARGWPGPTAIARPSSPWATGWPKGPWRAASWSTWIGLKSPDRPAKPTTSASVTVRLGLSHSSPTARSRKTERRDHVSRHGNDSEIGQPVVTFGRAQAPIIAKFWERIVQGKSAESSRSRPHASARRRIGSADPAVPAELRRFR